ncbi:hypothetical protein CN176_06405 [Sinorhizobium medicae]|uniref:hypothetical protein n=1 Tax=Sinorhizobium medicae TaxID=110321 RepID=UPI000FDA08D9|nr:hypothetical protein [Sinorhizobium medicae]RVJ43473.1 hypothetical protein CN176_06405 [Sinorhizobium medicae]
MSADIKPTQASSTSPRLKRTNARASKPNQQTVVPRPQDDPALMVGLALAFARQGTSDTRAIPSVLLERLRHLAESGDPTCRLVLDCLGRTVGANHRRGARQGVLTEIVSARSALQEEC